SRSGSEAAARATARLPQSKAKASSAGSSANSLLKSRLPRRGLAVTMPGIGVIAGKDDNGHAFGAGTFGVPQAGKLDRQYLETAEGARRLGELTLARRRRLAMGGGDGRTWLGNPFGKHRNLALGRTALENVTIHDPAMLCPRLSARVH